MVQPRDDRDAVPDLTNDATRLEDVGQVQRSAARAIPSSIDFMTRSSERSVWCVRRWCLSREIGLAVKTDQ